MTCCQIILALALSSVGCQPWAGQPIAPMTPTAPPIGAPYPVTSAPPTVIVPAPPYLETAPVVVEPAPQMVPVYPPPGPMVPLPSQTPGSIFGPPDEAQAAGLIPPPPIVAAPGAAPINPLSQVAPGGSVSPQFGLPPGPEMAGGLMNPIAVPVADENLAWDQIADVVSDYFTIAREQRAARGQVLMEGFIETAPQDGATWLEPHRRDSVGSFNRWESTFQTIRRRAVVRVIPDAAGYLVEVIVEKELEDLPKPEHAMAGAATFRNDGSLPSRRLEQVNRTRSAPRWIPLGRDPPLEQQMLAEIHARLSGIHTGGGSVFVP
jgi:hypothetical protein